MPRVLEPELLDALPQEDARATRSRDDLRRVNRLLGHDRILSRLLRRSGQRVHRLIDLGAGDGTLLLRVAQRLAPHWGRIQVVTIDRQSCLSPDTSRQLESLGWSHEVITADVSDALADLRGNQPQGTAILTNLFLHHFRHEDLLQMLMQASALCSVFVACEPQRGFLELLGSRCIGLLGCNSVTRHDAIASVRAGFKGHELSALWPTRSGWTVQEGRAGLFSHFFVARK